MDLKIKKLDQEPGTTLLYLEARTPEGKKTMIDLTFKGKTITISAEAVTKISVPGRPIVTLETQLKEGTICWPILKKDVKGIWKALFE